MSSSLMSKRSRMPATSIKLMISLTPKRLRGNDIRVSRAISTGSWWRCPWSEMVNGMWRLRPGE